VKSVQSNFLFALTRRVTRIAILIHIAFDFHSIAWNKDYQMTMTNGLATTVPFTQMTFVFPEADSLETRGRLMEIEPMALTTGFDSAVVRPIAPEVSVYGSGKIAFSSIPIGVEIPEQRRPAANTKRRNKPEHISDLLLVVLDRYGIDANEFMAGLE